MSLHNPERDFGDFIRAQGLDLEGDPQMDGRIHRLRAIKGNPNNKAGAYKGYLDGRPNGWVRNFLDGGEILKWRAERTERVSPEQQAQLAASLKAKVAQREAENNAKYEATAGIAKALWTESQPAISADPYSRKKGIADLNDTGVRVVPNAVSSDAASKGIKIARTSSEAKAMREADPESHVFKAGDLLVPAVDGDGKLWTLQSINPYFKSFMKNGRKAGAMHVIGALEDGKPILVAEGYATGASLAMAAEQLAVVAIAFDAGNLDAVVGQLKARYPSSPIAIMADDDRHRADGRNIGLEKARDAGTKHAVAVVPPQFNVDEKGATDFNDLHVREGLEAVRLQVERAIAQAADVRTAAPVPDQPVTQEPPPQKDIDMTEEAKAVEPPLRLTDKIQYSAHRNAEGQFASISVKLYEGKELVGKAKNIDRETLQGLIGSENAATIYVRLASAEADKRRVRGTLKGDHLKPVVTGGATNTHSKDEVSTPELPGNLVGSDANLKDDHLKPVTADDATNTHGKDEASLPELPGNMVSSDANLKDDHATPVTTADATNTNSNDEASTPELPRHKVGSDANHFINQNAQAERDLSDALGITPKIEELLARGMTAKEVTQDLSKAGLLDSVPLEDRHSLIVMTRATLGIPSQISEDGQEEFAIWKQARDQRLAENDATSVSIVENGIENDTREVITPEEIKQRLSEIRRADLTKAEQDKAQERAAALHRAEKTAIDLEEIRQRVEERRRGERAKASMTRPDVEVEEKIGDDKRMAAAPLRAHEINTQAQQQAFEDKGDKRQAGLLERLGMKRNRETALARAAAGQLPSHAKPLTNGVTGAASDERQPVPSEAISKLLESMTYEAQRDGSVLYLVNGKRAFTDHGQQILMHDAGNEEDEAILAAILLAKEKWGGRIELTGTEAFKQRALKLLVKHNIDVQLKNPEQDAARRKLLEASVTTGSNPTPPTGTAARATAVSEQPHSESEQAQPEDRPATSAPAAAPVMASDLSPIRAVDWWSTQHTAITYWSRSQTERDAELAKLGLKPPGEQVYWFEKGGRRCDPPADAEAYVESLTATDENLKEVNMANPKEETDDPPVVLRGVTKVGDEFQTTALLFKGKGPYLQGFITAGGEKHHVIVHINKRKPDGETGELRSNFLKVSERTGDPANPRWKEIGFGNAVNRRSDGKVVHFDEVLFNIGRDIVKARVTGATDPELHRSLGFLEARKPRDAANKRPPPMETPLPKAASPGALVQEGSAGDVPSTRSRHSTRARAAA